MFTSIFDDAFFDSFNALLQTPTYQTSVFPPMNTYTSDDGMTFEFALAGYAKEELQMERILCRVSPENKPSIAFLKQLGFGLSKQEDEWFFSYEL